MANVGIPKEEFEKELDRVQLSRRHADSAFTWIRNNRKKGGADIWYYSRNPGNGAAHVALDNGNKYFWRQAAKLIYLFALNEKDGLNQSPPFENANKFLQRWEWQNFKRVLEKLHIPIERSPELADSETNTPTKEDSMTDSIIDKALRLLPQFYQIIFHGPPGTGKTYCATQLLPKLLESPNSTPQELRDEGRWGIVQFHPSYNYEDFVRGVQVKTVPVKSNDGKADRSEVSYETLDRAFGKMCRKANTKENWNKKYALIIDEINRANVSAVLGELIYALEYRGEPIDTPYDAGYGKALTIPKNLYVIGTMNTADRTIGQIDYAVRRRFAFVACPPDKSVVYKKDGEEVRKIYDKVQALFGKTGNDGFLSSDFDSADVCIGHSYFLPSDKQAENPLHQIAQKIIWQVVPILREYVKDGILQDSEKLQEAIAEIKKDAENLPKKPLADESAESDSSADADTEENAPDRWRIFLWEKEGRSGIRTASRTVLAIVKDYVERYDTSLLQNLEKLQEWFPDSRKNGKNYGIKLRSDAVKNKFCVQHGEPLLLADGREVVVTSQWSAKNNTKPWDDFRSVVQEDHGYQIRDCYSMNVCENDGDRRSWNACREIGLLAAGGISDKNHRFGDELEKLKVGTIVFAFISGKGYVGMGKVIQEFCSIRDCVVDGTPLLDCKFNGGEIYKDAHPTALKTADSEECEWIVRIEWIKTFDSDKFIPFKGFRNTVWKMNVNARELKLLQKHFGENK